MGMRVPGSALPPNLVEQLMKMERAPIEMAKKRQGTITEEKKEVEKLQGLLSELDTAVNGLKTKTDFYKLKLESSHPDIIEGTVGANAVLGSYEFEVRGLAKNEKELAYGFPDKDETPVGFGYMLIERDDKGVFEVVIEPDSTLIDVAKQINDLEMGVKAIVVNTKYKPDPYRLLVISDTTGEEAKISIDEDTTFLEFKEQVTGRNLDVLFEDVPVTNNVNVLDEILEDVTLNIKRSEPGTRVQVTIGYDVDKTIEGIKSFVENYNKVLEFGHEQSKNPNEGKPGLLSGDGSIKAVMRQLQSSLFPLSGNSGQKFTTMAEIGITTNPKTGVLQLDESKVRKALADDYDSVAQLFIRTASNDGISERVAGRLKSFRDPASGVIRSKLRGLDRVIESQDKDIARRERQLEDKEQAIKRRFSALESQIQGLQAQGNFLTARFGAGGNPPQGGGG